MTRGRVILMILLSHHVCCLGSNFVDQPRFHVVNFIAANSDPQIRPVVNPNTTTDVVVDIALHTIVSLTWVDEFAHWDPADYGNITTVHMSSQVIWVPDIVIYNAIERDRTLDEIKKDYTATVNYEGNVQWLYPMVISSTCELNMSMFPADVQDCYLDVSTWTYNGFEVRVTNATDHLDVDSMTPNGEFRLIDGPVVPYELVYDCCPEPYYGIKYHLQLRRLGYFYWFNIGLPTCLMLVLAFVAILLPAESESKLSLGITIFLSQVVMVLVVTEYMPVQSLATPFMSQFMLSVLAVMTVYMVVSVFIIRIHQQAREAFHAPALLRILFINRVFLALFFPIRWRHHRRLVRGASDTSCEVEDPGNQYSNKRISHSNGVGPGMGMGQDNRGYQVSETSSTRNGAKYILQEELHKRDRATQTSDPSVGEQTAGLVCHKKGGHDTDLLALSEWTLLASMFERFWNVILAFVTLCILVWITLISFCIIDPESECDPRLFDPW